MVFKQNTERENPAPVHPWLPALLLLLVSCGCGYAVGSAYQAEIRTIHVPTFTSNSYRRGLEYRLTEAVQKEIQRQTHFRIVDGPQADSRLTGRIVAIRKDVLTETQFDDPRELQFSVAVEVTWEDLRNGRVLAQRTIELQPQAVDLLATAEFAPELGQSMATAEQRVADRLARQIVEMMEVPW